MGADLLHGNPRAGKLTSGGTESLFLAVQVARDHARAERGIAEPTIVLPETAHPAFAKACHYLDVTEVRVPVGPDGRADLAATAGGRRPDGLVVGSAPCYPFFGVVDPIPELATWPPSAARCATSTPAWAAGCCPSSNGSANRRPRGTCGFPA